MMIGRPHSTMKEANEAAIKNFNERPKDPDCDDAHMPSDVNKPVSFWGTVGMGMMDFTVMTEKCTPWDLGEDALRKVLLKRGVTPKAGAKKDALAEALANSLDKTRAARKKEVEIRNRKFAAEQREKTCFVCRGPGGVTKTDYLTSFVGSSPTVRVHMACARRSSEVVSSTQARKLLGPKLFTAKEGTADLPEAYGGSSSYGDIRWFLMSDIKKLKPTASLEALTKKKKGRTASAAGFGKSGGYKRGKWGY